MHGETSDDATIAAAARICVLLAVGLSRWFGPIGSHALLTRALASVRAHHPVLRGVAMTEEARLIGLAENASAHGADATHESIVAMFAALADLIGRLIGEDLAMNVLEQSTSFPTAGRSSAPTDPRTDADMTRSETP